MISRLTWRWYYTLHREQFNVAAFPPKDSDWKLRKRPRMLIWFRKTHLFPFDRIAVMTSVRELLCGQSSKTSFVIEPHAVYNSRLGKYPYIEFVVTVYPYVVSNESSREFGDSFALVVSRDVMGPSLNAETYEKRLMRYQTDATMYAGMVARDIEAMLYDANTDTYPMVTIRQPQEWKDKFRALQWE